MLAARLLKTWNKTLVRKTGGELGHTWKMEEIKFLLKFLKSGRDLVIGSVFLWNFIVCLFFSVQYELVKFYVSYMKSISPRYKFPSLAREQDQYEVNNCMSTAKRAHVSVQGRMQDRITVNISASTCGCLWRLTVCLFHVTTPPPVCLSSVFTDAANVGPIHKLSSTYFVFISCIHCILMLQSPRHATFLLVMRGSFSLCLILSHAFLSLVGFHICYTRWALWICFMDINTVFCFRAEVLLYGHHSSPSNSPYLVEFVPLVKYTWMHRRELWSK